MRTDEETFRSACPKPFDVKTVISSDFKPCSGCSLLELIVSVALMSIFVSAAVPAIAAVKRKTEAQKQIDVFARWFSVLHSKSLNQQTDISVTATAEELLAVDAKHTVVGRKKIPAFTKISFSTKTLEFYGTGVQSPSTVRLSMNRVDCACRLSLRGRITTECL